MGYFKEGESRVQDIDMWTRIGIHYPVAFNSTILAKYRLDATNRACLLTPILHDPAFSITLSEAINAGIVPPDKIEGLKEFGAHYRYFLAKQLIANNEKELAIKIINKTRDTKRFYRKGWILLILAYLPPFFMKFTLKIYRYLFIVNPLVESPFSIKINFK